MRAPGAGGGGEGREGEEERAAVAVTILGVGWGRHSQPQVRPAPGAAEGAEGCWVGGSVSARPDSQVGEGRSRSRGQPHGEGAGQGRERGAVCVWGWGAAAPGEEGGSCSPSFDCRGRVCVCFFSPGSWGGGPPCLRGPPGQLGLPAGQGRDWGARRGRVAGAHSGAGTGSSGRAAGEAGDAVPPGLLPGTR